MTALRREALKMVENFPEEKLGLLVDFMRPVCVQDDGNDPLAFLSGLLAGTPYVTAKEIREERLQEKYADYL